MKALYIASTGMSAQERNVEVISNNIANMRTTGFKRQRAEFQDLLYQAYRRAGSTTSDQGTVVPVGIEIGSGVKTAATPRIMSQGSVVPTEKELDVAVRGEGYFMVSCPTAAPATPATAPSSATIRAFWSTWTATRSSRASPFPMAQTPSRSAPTARSRPISATTRCPPNSARSSSRASSTRRASSRSATTCSSRPALRPGPDRSPAADGMGKLMQGYLEMANVNAVTEIADLIAAQRAYEMNARVVSGADEMLQATSQLR
jgi:flagellar basal-body rod protein FlgG